MSVSFVAIDFGVIDVDLLVVRDSKGVIVGTFPPSESAKAHREMRRAAGIGVRLSYAVESYSVDAVTGALVD